MILAFTKHVWGQTQLVLSSLSSLGTWALVVLFSWFLFDHFISFENFDSHLL
jgi:hypothetical protein